MVIMQGIVANDQKNMHLCWEEHPTPKKLSNPTVEILEASPSYQRHLPPHHTLRGVFVPID